MFDSQYIERAGLVAALARMPAAVIIAEAPSGKLILINERARWMLKRNMGFSGVPDPEEIADFGDLGMFHPDGRPVEMEEWPLVRSITSGEEVREEAGNMDVLTRTCARPGGMKLAVARPRGLLTPLEGPGCSGGLFGAIF